MKIVTLPSKQSLFMQRTLFLFLFAVLCSLNAANAQQDTYYGKRPITGSEIRQLAEHRDTLVRDLNRLYKKEKKLNTPGKYQPERIALVRQYLLLFEYLEEQADIVYFSEANVISILGRPDSTYNESGYHVFLYNSINNRYFRIRNIQYNLVFKNRELIFVKRRDN
jgi:hypothetical protein